MDQIPNDPMDPCMHKRFVQVESYACPARITVGGGGGGGGLRYAGKIFRTWILLGYIHKNH